MSRKKIVVPEADYQPTEAELHEPVVVEPGTTPEQLAKALMAPTEVERVSKEEWRRRRRRG